MSLSTFVDGIVSGNTLNDRVLTFLTSYIGAGYSADNWLKFFQMWAAAHDLTFSGHLNDQARQLLLAYLAIPDTGQTINDLWMLAQATFVMNGFGPNIVPNGGFLGLDLGWLLGSGWSTVLGLSLKVAGVQADLVSTDAVPVAGVAYQVKYTITALTLGTFTARLGNVAGVARSAPGTYTETITTVNTDPFAIRASALAVGSLTDISIRRIL